MRQRRSRYAIRAGRNLPDKEFRYLRMVIVTTAVYWGLNSQLRPKRANQSSSPSSTGQASVRIPRLATSSHGPVFLINSRFPHFSAATHNAHRTRGDCRTWPPFSRSYGGILPSSLTIVHPNALVSSTRPPVSVSGTGRAHTSLEAFLDSTGTSNIPNNLGTHHASPYMQNGFTYPTGHTLTPQSNKWP